MSRYYLGIDGGQSSTTALIASETGRVLGGGRGGPCNHVGAAEGRAKFFSAVGSCLEQACREAHIEPGIAFAAACLGFSGGAEDKAGYARELIRSAKFHITHDAEIALLGATGGEPGVIVIAGTGSMAFGRNAEGHTARAGGWGYIFGDEGGGFDLTRRALRAVLQEEEGWGSPTSLRTLLLRETGAANANDLLHRFYTDEYSRTRIAGLATLVTQAAESGDAVAHRILQEAASALAWFAENAYTQLFQPEEKAIVAYIGGAFRSAPLLNAFKQQIVETIGWEPIPPRFGPAAGALLEALRLDGNRSALSNIPTEKPKPDALRYAPRE